MDKSGEGIKKVLYIIGNYSFLMEMKLRSRKKDFINKITDFLRKFLLISGILTFL